MEQFRSINDTKYSISESGIIKNNAIGITLRQHTDRCGYKTILLSTKNKQNRVFIHRLVATAFLNRPKEHQDCINHKDLNKTNNHFSNLEWCTRKENNRHYQDNSNTRKPIVCINTRTLECIRYESIHAATRILNVDIRRIRDTLKCKQKTFRNQRVIYEEIPEVL